MSKEFKIGLLIIVAGSLLYYGFNYLQGRDLFSNMKKYYVYYPNLSGLKLSNPVMYQGLPVGRVSEFKLEQNKKRIVVTLDIDENMFIGDDAKAILANEDVFGSKAVILEIGQSKTPMKEGDTLIAKINEGLLSQFEPVADNLNSTISKINQLLDNLNALDIKGLVDTLTYTIVLISEKLNTLDIQQPMDSLTSLIGSLQARADQLEGVIIESNTFIQSLNRLPLEKTTENLNQTILEIKSITKSIQNQEGTMGKLLHDDQLYIDLQNTLQHLDTLLVHINQYPKHFLAPLGKSRRQIEKELSKSQN